MLPLHVNGPGPGDNNQIKTSRLGNSLNNMLEVFTSQYRYNGPHRLDITVKGKDPFGKYFAPTWKMVIKSKKGLMTQEEYTQEYYSLMRKSYITYPHIWKRLLCMKKIVLVCFCSPNTFCHRLILAEILQKLGAVYKGEILL